MREVIVANYPWIVSALSCVATAIAAFTDTRTGHIPNWLTFPFLGIGLGIAGATFGFEGLKYAALGAAACFALPYLMFRAGGMGGGDVKLFAGLGAMLGMRLGLETMLVAMSVGACWAMIKLARSGRLRGMLQNAFRLSTNWILPKKLERPLDAAASDTLRLGFSIFLGTVSVLGYRLGVMR